VLTIFTTAKPFVGHSGVIQRNAIKSWRLLNPNTEIILFGDDAGAAEVAGEFGLRFEPHIARNEFGTKRLDYLFDRAQEIARHEILCYVNCDIILTHDFVNAVAGVCSLKERFLMVGRRWDVDISTSIDYSAPSWEADVRRQALATNRQRPACWIDYFVFPRGLYRQQIPPFVIGRVFWDNWLVWRAPGLGAPVVDASAVVQAIHQNHDYGYHPKGKSGVWNDEQSQSNFRHSGGYVHLRAIDSADLLLTASGLKQNHFAKLAFPISEVRRRSVKMWDTLIAFTQSWIWHPILSITRPMRRKLGLRRHRA
jgi:hypothetical protein